MSESEKRLRGALLSEVREYAHGGGERVEAALRALLAEHRAEVASARNAALEEAALVLAGDGLPVVREMQHQIRALQSAPVAVLDAQKVREVLLALRASALDPRSVGISHERASGRLDFVVLAAERLGLPLDAEGAGECGCGHVSIASNNLCMAPVRTPGGSVASCGCSHPSHAMPAPREPAAGEVYEEPRHDVPPGTCSGCDAKADAPSEQHRFGCTVHGRRQLVVTARDIRDEDV